MSTKVSKTETGVYGESIAAETLIAKGYTILERNYRSFHAEIDVIAKYGSYLVFVEVKYRRNLLYGYPREAVGKVKQRNIIRAAQYYLIQKNTGDCDIRFDVVEILDKGGGKPMEIVHIENAFWCQ